MKLLFFSFLFLISFSILNAQETNERVLFTGGILLDKFTLKESYTRIGDSNRTSAQFLNYGVPATYFHDGQETRGQLSLGLKKFNTKGHSTAFNIFVGRDRWSRKTLVTVETEDFQEWDNTEITVPVYIGVVTQNTFGINATKSYCITREETRLKAYLGARAEAIYTISEFTGELEGEFATDREKVELQAIFVPEVTYFFPGDKFAMSVGLNLPMIGGEWNTEEISNPNLTEEQRSDSYSVLDFLNLRKSRFEMGFSWIL